MSPPTKLVKLSQQVIGIDDLPPEMIGELFEHLQPKDLAACSMVNKRWHSIYAAFKLHRLAVTEYVSKWYRYLVKWHSSNRPIQEAERCDLAMFRRLAKKPLLSNLRHLAFSGSFEFDLNDLNRFQQLVHLEIDTHLAGNVHLNLPRLRVLAFHYCNENCALSIDCPQLSTLVYYEDDPFLEPPYLLELKQPETIRVLETSLVGPQLAPFKSVECLITGEFEAISKATLLSLPRLRELRYEANIENLVDSEFESEIGAIDRMKRMLSEFLDEAKKLRGSDFRFTFSGFQLANVKLDQIDFGVQVDEEDHYEWVHNEYIYMKNCHLIEPSAMQFIRLVYYTSLLSHVTGEFPRCFFEKFTAIKEVEVRDAVKDADHLLWFLKSLKFLRKLVLEDRGFSQKFYDQLPAAAHSLIRLELEGCWKTELQLNFDFLAEFPVLLELEIFGPLSLGSITSALRSSAKLICACFQVLQKENGLLRIQRERGSTIWRIRVRGSLLFEAENPDEIVNFVKELRA